MSRLSLFTYQLSMDLVMESFWDLNQHGFLKHINHEEKLIVPYLAAFSADLMEAWDASCRPKNGTYCHLQLRGLSKNDYTTSDVRQYS